MTTQQATLVEEWAIPASAFRATAGRPVLKGDAWALPPGSAIECTVDPAILRAGDRLLAFDADMAAHASGFLHLEMVELGAPPRDYREGPERVTGSYAGTTGPITRRRTIGAGAITFKVFAEELGAGLHEFRAVYVRRARGHG